MDHPLIDHIDRMIAKAEQDGAFKDLPGAGKPLAGLHVPGDAVLDRIMHESGARPLAVTLRAQIAEARARLAGLTGETARHEEMRRLADLETRLAIEVEALRRLG
ncbi:DnaJ family domain-containing protein [uncultured Limimaricola sp.]|uniref:DnaJ family domain-containing protein n=1 Tax=uncultured Limimaricola sp. TaxID=2211667 RepID=UPI0030F4F03D